MGHFHHRERRMLRHNTAGVEHSTEHVDADRIQVLEAILGANERLAAENRIDFDAAGVRVVNLMSAPGAGKTTLLRTTLQKAQGRMDIGVLEGDIETSLDADRLAGFGAPIALINTSRGFGGECHLDANMVRSALANLPLCNLDVLIVENVGNLVCPAEFAIGEHAKVMVYAVTEGEEKPLKYPVMFRNAELVVVNKIDLLPYLDFDLDAFYANLRQVNPSAITIEMSTKTGEGVGDWCDWLSMISGSA